MHTCSRPTEKIGRHYPRLSRQPGLCLRFSCLWPVNCWLCSTLQRCSTLFAPRVSRGHKRGMGKKYGAEGTGRRKIFWLIWLLDLLLNLSARIRRVWRLACKMDLTKAALKKMCRDSGLYSSPALNDKLYLHYKVRKGSFVGPTWSRHRRSCSIEDKGGRRSSKATLPRND